MAPKSINKSEFVINVDRLNRCGSTEQTNRHVVQSYVCKWRESDWNKSGSLTNTYSDKIKGVRRTNIKS